MSTQEVPIASFLKELVRRRKRLPNQLAADLGISHATVSRWLSERIFPASSLAGGWLNIAVCLCGRFFLSRVTCLK